MNFLILFILSTSVFGMDNGTDPQSVSGDPVQERQERFLGLDDAITIGLEYNWGIRIRRNEAEIAANNRTLGNAGFLPSVELQGSRGGSVEDSRFQLADDPQTRENVGARSTTTSGGLTLNWTIFDGLGMFVSHERLGELEGIGRLEYQLQVEETIQRIIQLYIEIVRFSEQTEVLESSLEVTRERIEIAETKRDLGTGSEYELLEARTDLNADQAALMREKNRLEEARIRLNELLGRDQDLEFTVMEEIPLNRELRYEELHARSVSENRELQLARVESKIAELEVRQIRSERFPELELNGGYRYNRTDGGGGFLRFNETDGFHVGLTARINLFDGFQTGRRVQNARIHQRNRQLELEQTLHRLEAGLLAYWRFYEHSLELVDLEQMNLENAAERLDIALERFREGVISALEFREAQRVFLAAGTRLLEARFDAKVAETELLRLSGALGEMAI